MLYPYFCWFDSVLQPIIKKQNDPINQHFIPYKDILKSILPRGNMFSIINSHFDQNDHKQYSEDEIRGMYEQYSFALNEVGEGEISNTVVSVSIVEM